MDSADETKVRGILGRHIQEALEEISNEEIDVGYYPEDDGCIVDAALNVIKHQARIDRYHKTQKTNFGPSK